MVPKRKRQTEEVPLEDDSEDQSEDESEEEAEDNPAQQNSEEEDSRKSKNPTLGLRCVPKDVHGAAQLLKREAKDVVKDCGFGGVLDINVTRCFSVERILFMMSKCDVSAEDESFTIVLSEDKKIKVTPEKVKRVFGIPDGTPDGGSDPVMNEKHWSTKWEDFWQLLKSKGSKVVRMSKVKKNGETTVKETKEITVKAVKEYIKSVKDNKHEQARAFLYIVVSKLLIPTHSDYILKQHVGMCSDFGWMKNFNWCRFVCQDLKNKIASWQKKKTKSKVEGSSLLLLMCFIETLEPQPGPEQPSVEPLIKLYDNKKVENLLGNLKDIQEIRKEVAKYQPRPASKKQQVPRQKGKQPASKNQQVTGQQIGFLSVEDLLKECEVDEGDRGVLLRELNRRIKYGEAMLKENLEKIRDKTNEDLKVIVADHSKWSRLYNEIKYKAQIEDMKIKNKMAKTVVVQIHDVQMTELKFVQSFKPGGHLCDDVMEIFRLIWKESRNDMIMLSRGAVDQLLGVDKRSGFLEREFKDYDIKGIPSAVGSRTAGIAEMHCRDSGNKNDHWSLVVVEPDLHLITVLDSLCDLEGSTKRHEGLIIALRHFLSSIGLNCTDFLSSTPSVRKQKNLDDCGFHTLLYIMRYKDGNYKNIGEDEILICRQHTAWFLLEHKDNVLRGAFTYKHSLEDKDARKKKKQKNNDKDGGTSGGQKSDDGDEGSEEEDDRDGGTSGGERSDDGDGGGEESKRAKKKTSLDGRNITKALKATTRKNMVDQRDRSLVSPFHKEDTWTQNLVDEQLELQLWKKIIDNEEYTSVVFMSLHNKVVTDCWKLSGYDISKSFGTGGFCEDTVMSMYVSCLIDDESYHGPNTVGYRIFLYPKISELLLLKKENYKINSVVEELKQQYSAEQILKARHILLPVCYKSHWTVYIVNKSYGQIDVLDSGLTTLKEKQTWHKPVASNIRTRLGEAILKITQSEFDFSGWSVPVITGLPRQDSNGSRFFAMMFLKHYNPDTREVAFWDLNKENLRRKILWYLINHKLNGSRNSLPEGIISSTST